jgi:integrase
VLALEHWLKDAGVIDGPLFRPVDRYGHVGPRRLSGDAVSVILRARAVRAGFDSTGYSGHSLRAGFVTSAIAAGAPSHKVRQQTGHSSDVSLARYIREAELFTGNAAGVLL